MNTDTPLPFDLPAVRRKKLTVDFNGGNQSSDAGLLLLREAEPRLGVCRRLAAAMPDRRDPDRILHEMFEMVAARAMAIARVRIRDVVDARVRIQGRHRPRPAAPRSAHEGRRRPLSADRRVASVAIDHLSSGELPEQDRSGAACCGSPRSVRHDHEAGQDGDPRHRRHVLRGARDERGFASMHIYHVASGTPVAAILRPARTPKGTEVCTVVKHVTKRLREHWPNTRIVWRGDSHYGRVEAMEWAENNGSDYIFGLQGNAVLNAIVAKTADNLRFHHAKSRQEKVRTYTSFSYQASSWKRPRKVVARLECSFQPNEGATTSTGMRQEVDVRYVVTSLKGPAQYLYEVGYCERGQAENLIKLHKAQLASKAEFATIRERLIKIGARIIEHAARIRIQLPTSCPEGALFRTVALGIMPSAP